MTLAVIDHIEHPFGRGLLTENGVQYSQEKITTTDDFEAVEEITVSPPALGKVIEFEFGLTCAVKSSSSAESVILKWQARNKGGAWIDLTGEVTYEADASEYKDFTYSGRFQPVTGFDSLPFDVRLVIKSGSAGGESAAGKTKNSSYIRVIYSGS